MHTNIATSMLLAAIVALSAISLTTQTQTIAQTETSTSISGGFADIKTVQDEDHIFITISKVGAEATDPEEPIVISPNKTEDGTGVVVVPLPTENDTATEGNATEIIIIQPDGNVTTVENGNVTNIDNSTVVVAPTNQTVTETDGGVVVVDPVPCGCPADEPQNQTDTTEQPEPGTPPVIEEPATTTNGTVLVPTTEGNETTTNETEGDSEDNDNGNDSSNGNGNGNGENNEINNPFLGTPG